MLNPSFRATQFTFEVVTVDPTGQVCDRQQQSTQGWLEPLPEGATLELVEIPAGSFLMGAARSEIGWAATQAPQHPVVLPPFIMGRYPVTQAQWEAVATLPKINCFLNPQPANRLAPDRPVEQVSWREAVEFCDRLSTATGRLYRLPSEAEWEYACRAGSSTPFHFGPTITTDLANYSGIDWEYAGRICSHGAYGSGPHGSDRRETTPVGSFQVANRFGLYDMHGNVREWCLDQWHPTYLDAPNDGTAWITDETSDRRVVRGGSWNGGPRICRSAFRSDATSERGLYDIGLRVVGPLPTA